MSSLKRNFSLFQNESKQSIVSTATKKVKLSSEPNIKVYTRFRPVSSENYTGNFFSIISYWCQDTYQIDGMENSIMINKPEEVITKNGGIKKFFFSEVFEPETTQEEITHQTCVPLIEDLFNQRMTKLLIEL